MYRRLTALLLIAFLLLLPTPRAQAGWVWCPGDPVIQLNGTLVDITIAIPLEYVLLVNGPVRYEIQTPVGVDRRLIVADLGYGQGNQIVFTDSSEVLTPPWIPTNIIVHVPIDMSRLLPGTIVPAQLRITPLVGSIVTTQGTSQLVTAQLDILGLTSEVEHTATPQQSPSPTTEPTIVTTPLGTPTVETSVTETPTPNVQGEVNFFAFLPLVGR